MPELSGSELKKIINPRIKVIFTTAYSDYALDGYDLNVVDYLLKPITFQRFLQAIEKLGEDRKAAATVLGKPNEYLFVKTEYRLQKIRYDEILYFKGLSDYVMIQTKSGKILTLQKMKELERKLTDSSYLRVHKSYIVTLPEIEFVFKGNIYQLVRPIKKPFSQRLVRNEFLLLFIDIVKNVSGLNGVGPIFRKVQYSFARGLGSSIILQFKLCPC